MNKIEHLAYRCYKILPLVYDESLSYYEVICKCAEKLNEVITSMDEMVTDFNQWEERIDEIESSFDSIETTLALHTTQITGLQGDITNLGQSIAEIESQINALESTVAGHTTQIGGIQSDLTEIDSQISALESAVDDLQNDKMNKANPKGTGSFQMNTAASLGSNCVAAGTNSKADGANSVAIGNNANVTGNNSVGFGYYPTVSGANAMAEGRRCEAKNICSHAEGDYTIAAAAAQHAAGKYNRQMTSGLRVTGNGTDESTRRNAEFLDDSGNLYLAGDVYVGCQADSTGGTKIENTAVRFYRHNIRIQTANEITTARGRIAVFFEMYNKRSYIYTFEEYLTILRNPITCHGYFLTSNEAITGISYTPPASAGADGTIAIDFIDASTAKESSLSIPFTLTSNDISQTSYVEMP